MATAGPERYINSRHSVEPSALAFHYSTRIVEPCALALPYTDAQCARHVRGDPGCFVSAHRDTVGFSEFFLLSACLPCTRRSCLFCLRALRSARRSWFAQFFFQC